MAFEGVKEYTSFQIPHFHRMIFDVDKAVTARGDQATIWRQQQIRYAIGMTFKGVDEYTSFQIPHFHRMISAVAVTRGKEATIRCQQ